jgi:uridine kinase
MRIERLRGRKMETVKNGWTEVHAAMEANIEEKGALIDSLIKQNMELVVELGTARAALKTIGITLRDIGGVKN